VSWPVYEVDRFQLDDPAIAALATRYAALAELTTLGAPRTALWRCEADSRLTLIPSHRRMVAGSEGATRQGGPLVRFATACRRTAVALDPASGEVVTVLDLAEPTARLMNSSLVHLHETVKAVITRFPYYDRESPTLDDEADKACRDLIVLIDAADPHARDEDGLWSEFPWDVAMGDFDTQSVVQGAA
jgi:hypothetical protein